MTRQSPGNNPVRLENARLEELLQVRDVSCMPESKLEQLFHDDKNLAAFAPDGDWAEDPRSGEIVVFNPARARRPSSYVADRADVKTIHPADCPICSGKTTGAVDAARLSDGHTFINKNLYAAVFPHQAVRDAVGSANVEDAGNHAGGVHRICGLHFLQWTSTVHDRDWHNMPLSDCVIVMRRLAALEAALLNGDKSAASADTASSPRAIMIIKNYGVAVGGSLAHGHQQIIAGNFMPRRLRDDIDFQTRHDETFSAWMLRRNPAELLVRDYERAALVAPYFMSRPFNMLWLLRDHTKKYLHELNDGELAACAAAWRDVMRAYLRLLPSIGRAPSFNILVHNGPGAGLYCEFMPFTQEYGGFERLGFYVCQSAPAPAALMLREVLQALPT